MTGSTAWMDLKKNIKLTPFEYCYRCGLPQGEFLPIGHPAFERGRARVLCPFEDFVALICWFIFTNPSIYTKAKEAFPELRKVREMQVEDFSKWINIINDLSFYNGLELVLWYWNNYKKP